MRPSPRSGAILQALLVTFLWATSWVLIKRALPSGTPGSTGGIPPLTFAGLRYSLAFACLLPLAARPAHRARLRALPRQAWARLAALGLLFYTLTQGAQFVALQYLPAANVNLVLSFTTALVALLGWALLTERPTALQWAGMAVALAGALLFFAPARAALVFAPATALGYLAAAVGLLANAASSVLGRQVNRSGSLPPLLVTTISMGLGAAVLLALGLGLQGLPPLTPAQWATIAWLAVVNTAFAFTLWNHTLRTLSAVESSIINNLLIIQIPLLAWLLLGEALTPLKVLGLALAAIGALVVQLRWPIAPLQPPAAPAATPPATR